MTGLCKSFIIFIITNRKSSWKCQHDSINHIPIAERHWSLNTCTPIWWKTSFREVLIRPIYSLLYFSRISFETICNITLWKKVFFPQKPHLRSLVRFWYAFWYFLMFAGDKKQINDIKLVIMLSKTDIHWSSKLRIHVILFKLETIFSKTALPWSHLHLEWPHNFVT